jgi:hypothetical protein
MSRLQAGHTGPIFYNNDNTCGGPGGEVGTRGCRRGGEGRRGTASSDTATSCVTLRRGRSANPHLDRVERVHDAVLEDSSDGTCGHRYGHIGGRQLLVLVWIHGRVGCGVSACRRTPLLELSVPDRRPNAPALRSGTLSRARPTEKLDHRSPFSRVGVVRC